jgi:hypothetical protein
VKVHVNPFSSCANHPDLPSARKCPKCAHAFCDACLAFSVNGVPWCEPCGNALADEVKPRWALGGLVLAAGYTLTTLVWTAKRVFLPTLIPNFLVVILLGYASSMYAAWSALSRTAREPPDIERR